jgi:hypothetical protein
MFILVRFPKAVWRVEHVAVEVDVGAGCEELAKFLGYLCVGHLYVAGATQLVKQRLICRYFLFDFFLVIREFYGLRHGV